MPHSYNPNNDRPRCFATAICNANNAICARRVHLGLCCRSMPEPKKAVDGFQDHSIPLGGIKTGQAEYERIAQDDKTTPGRRGHEASRPRQASLF